jgi:hypothetical protein
MSAASDYLEDALLDHVLGNTAYTQPANFLSLHTGSPLDDDTGGNECQTPGSGGYTRQALSFAAASGGSCSTDGTVTFSAATTNWGTISHIGIYDAGTGGNLLFHGAVTTSKLIETGDTFQVSTGNLTITLA